MTGSRLLSVLGLAAFVAAAAGSAAPAADSAIPARPGAQLGRTLAGETCQLNGGATTTQTADILCGASTDAVGTLQMAPLAAALPQVPAQRRDAILRNARAMQGGLGITGQMSCDAGQALGSAADGDAMLFLCVVQSNSWPRIILLSTSDRALYRAEGLPGMFPVLQAAIAAASGRKIVAGETDAGQRILDAKLPRAVVQSSSTDFANYRQFVELGRLYSSADNFAGAETAYRSALEIETRLFGPNAITVGQTLAELALQVSNQGRFDEATDLFLRATPIIAAAPSVAVRARLASYRALDAANRRAFADALTFARAATALRRSEVEAAGAVNETAGGAPVGPTLSEGELAHSLRIEAEMALRLGDFAGAQAAGEEALWIISQEPGLPLWWRPEVVALMGDINAARGRVVNAERDYQDALKLNQNLFGDTAPTALMHLRMGQFYSDQQIYPTALASFRAAFAILAKDTVARSEVVPDQIVPFFAAAAMQPDPQQRRILDTEMFRASQLIGSDVADQTIARAAARQASGNPALADLVRQAQDAERDRSNIRMNLAAEYAKTDDQRDAARESALADRLKVASAKSDQLLMRVTQAFPDYAKFADPGPAELSDVQARLQPGEGFLSFIVGVKASYALLVTPQGLTARRLEVTSETLAADIGDLRRAFVLQLGAAPDFSLKSSFDLYRQLLGPLETELGNVNHLIVAPGGDLSSLPFALLVTAAPRASAETAYGEAAWLIRRMAVSQIPSPRAFLSLRDAQRRRVPAPRAFLGIGNPNFGGAAGGGQALNALAASCREGGPMAPGLLRTLAPLPDTAAEVNAAAVVLAGNGNQVLLGADATEANFRAQPLDQFGVIYFATHGLLPGELHCQSEPGLVLSPPATQSATTDTDGLLEAGEISALNLNADLVVLSACNTAAAGGGRFGGGALEGLADAFFNAGARSVLASHWAVPSASTMQLMSDVFGRVGRQGASRDLAEALRQAQLDLIAQPGTAHPINWGAFTIIGDGVTLAQTASNP